MASLKEIIESLEGRGFNMDMTRGLRGEARTKAGYPSGGRIAGETARKMFLEQSSQLPYTQDIFGPIPDQYFDPETKLGSGVNQVLRQIAGVGYAGGDALVRAPLQAVYNVGRMYDTLGKGIGEYAMLPTDRKQKEISDEIGQFTRAQIPRDTVNEMMPPGAALDDELSQLSAALAEKRIPKQTQAEREEMEELSGVPTGSRGSGEFLPELSEEVQAIVGAAEGAGGGEQAGAGAGARPGDSTTTTTTTTKKTTTRDDDLGPMGPDGAPGDDGSKKSPALDNIFSKIMQDIDSLKSGEEQEPKTLKEYKQEFADATGINISGDVDKSHALMAFGLSLMQNKAGKGFNIGNILGAVGEAGEKAMPAFIAAKERARDQEIAAGKYALQERKNAAATLAANRQEQIKYLRDRRDAVLDRMADREDEQAKAYTKFLYDREIENIKQSGKAAEAAAKGKEFKGLYDDLLLPGNQQMKVKYGFIGTNPYFANPVNDGRAVANQYVKSSKTMKAIDNLEDILNYYGGQASPAGSVIFDKGLDFLSAYGIVDGEKWFGERGISSASQADVIVDALIQENKRFISQETGNGVSEGDKKDIATVIGRISLTDPVEKNISRLNELRRLFAAPMNVLAGQIEAFNDIDNYATQDMYDKTQAMLKTELSYLQEQMGSSQGGAPVDVRS